MNATRRVLWIALLLAIATSAPAQGPALNVVPRPATVEARTGTFQLTGDTRIVAADEESRRIARAFNDFLLEQHGLHLQITGARPRSQNYISFSQDRSRGLVDEGYHLVIGPGDIRVTGRPAGLFYGMQTLTQLLPLEIKPAIELPALAITDYPRFDYRGLLLDVGRHYFSVEHIKKMLDLAAQYRINRFHWHLTDDQGWRIEIKKYPRLTEVGSYVDDTSPGGRYYTQEQIKDLVAYAQARFITVIPEIEMPGHAGAAVAAYPQLACTPGVGANVLCPSDATFAFLRDVLTEVGALFPGPYIHIGSDEVDKRWWRESPAAQAIIRREGLKSEDELQSYFVRRIEQFLGSTGKRTIGWDEILEGGLAPNAIVMSWRGEEGGIEAVQQKHQAIMTPSEYCYFDYYQGDPRREPLAIGGFVPLEKVYGYEPIPRALQGQAREYVLGAQASVWTEYISTPDHLEYMVFPRLLAFSEAVWSPAAVRDYGDFERRLPYQLQRLDKQDVRFRIPEPAGLHDFYTATDDHALVDLRSFIPGSRVHYTLDGSEPTTDSLLYTGPFQVSLPPEQKKSLNTIVVTPAGRRSMVYGATFQRRSYREAISVADAQPGLRFALFDGTFATVQSIGQGAQAATGTANSFDLQQFGRAVNYGISVAGYLKVEADGYYQFAVESDDGSLLQIDDEVVVDNDGNHPSRVISGHIPLRQGFHKIKLLYFQAEGNVALRVSWGAAGAELQPLPESALYH
ncbi:MAG TPA: family 20 glycosylhydrolase [Steroidobacteraceae bacterium]|jgi:hexosaminidase